MDEMKPLLAIGRKWSTSTISVTAADRLWDTNRPDAVRNVDGIFLWNRSVEDPAIASSLGSSMGMTNAEVEQVGKWVNLFRTVTPKLVARTLLGAEYPEKGETFFDDKQRLLAWMQLGNGMSCSSLLKRNGKKRKLL